MNPMNVGGINPGVGGPVGGVQMGNNGSMVTRNDGSMNNSPEVMIGNLNTYIYDYFLKRGYHDCARALVKDESIKLNTEPPIKTSPGQRREGDVNGVDGDAVMADSKDGDKLKIPEDLPRPNLNSESQSSSFLLDWFSLFWEFFWSQRKKGNSADVRQYLQHTQNMMRIREQQQNQMFRNQQQMMPGQMGRLNNMRGNGMVPPNLQKAVLQNNTSGFSQQQYAQLQQKSQQMQMMQMQREHSDMDMNGHRPPSPSSAENAPSPSKRPRLEGGPMNGQQLAPNGRGQGQAMPGQQNPMLIQNGLTPRPMNPNQFGAFQQSGPAAQPKPIQVYAQNLALHHSRSAMNNQGMSNGLMNPGVMPNQADLVPMSDGQGMYQMNNGEFYPNGQMAQVRPGAQTPGGQHGNHALQDYQMQLMLLEQQNKRRLMMARQEQDSMTRGPDGQPLPGQQGQQQQGQMPPGTSPQGSRTGASPIPNDQMKRNTPKMNQSGLPNSPNAPDAMMQGRGSPASINFTGQLPPEMAGQFYIKTMQDGMQSANGMRPPSSNPAFSGPQLGQPVPAGAANRMPNGGWQPQPGGQPVVPQQSPILQPPTTGTPQSVNSMPPPQPPAANASRQPPPSPQTGNAAPPTPQPATKTAPKKKETKDRAKRPTKKTAAAAAAAAANNTTATPSSEAEQPPTPTPATPITPQHHQSFNKSGANATAGAPPQPTSAPAQQTLVQPPPPDQTQQSFNDLAMPDPSAFSLDFSALENPDILENFDFDTFLNTDTDTAGFGFDPSISYPDGVETGTESGL